MSTTRECTTSSICPLTAAYQPNKTKCNQGYCFINFINCATIMSFYYKFDGKRWNRFNSDKICELKYARIQGRTALIEHFRTGNALQNQSKNLVFHN
jgi:hypothetical protein